MCPDYCAGDVRSLKVVDFGNAIHCTYEEMSLYYENFDLQTLLYRAPEVMFGMSFGLEVDMWSLGCVLAELYVGRPVFHGENKFAILRKVFFSCNGFSGFNCKIILNLKS